MKKLMTAEQAFNLSMNTYPTLYASTSLKKAKFKYYDQIFNVIGNGYSDYEDFVEDHTINKNNKDLIQSFPHKYITKQDLYIGYTKLRNRGSVKLPDFESALNVLLTKEELEQRKDIVYFNLANEGKGKIVPYPNFQKEYSLIWNLNLEKIDDTWKKAAIDYYEIAKAYFKSDKVHSYHGAIPKDENKLDNLVKNYEENLARERTEGMSEKEYFEKITKAYETEFNGNVLEFIKNRWNKEHIRILGFIEETLEYLNNNLENTKNVKKNFIIKK